MRLVDGLGYTVGFLTQRIGKNLLRVVFFLKKKKKTAQKKPAQGSF